MSEYSFSTRPDRPGSNWRPIALDGAVRFVEFDNESVADDAGWIFEVQLNVVRGWFPEAALTGLPVCFYDGGRVVRQPDELARLAEDGHFDDDYLSFMLFGVWRPERVPPGSVQ